MSKLARAFFLLGALILVGTLGLFILEEEYSILDALYMTVITITTVGYGEVHGLSAPGRVFVMSFLVVGLGVFLYSAAQLGEWIVRVQLSDWLEKRKMSTALKSLKDHFIVCGFGRMGQSLCRELALRGLKFVAIDRDAEVLAECQAEGWHWLVGDATDDRTLLNAGIERARGVVSVLGSDADNLYVVFSARFISKDIRILARASDEKGAAKMEKAGANRVISLYATGATKMAQLLSNPNVEDFLEIVTTRGQELDMAEIQVSSASPYAGQTLAQTDFSRRGLMIVGIRRPEGGLLLPPPSQTRIESGDLLIVMGRTPAVQELCAQA